MSEGVSERLVYEYTCERDTQRQREAVKWKKPKNDRQVKHTTA